MHLACEHTTSDGQTDRISGTLTNGMVYSVGHLRISNTLSVQKSMHHVKLYLPYGNTVSVSLTRWILLSKTLL